MNGVILDDFENDFEKERIDLKKLKDDLKVRGELIKDGAQRNEKSITMKY